MHTPFFASCLNRNSLKIDNISDFIVPFLLPYLGFIPNPQMSFISPMSCILVLISPIFMIYSPECEGKGSFPNSQIKSLIS